MPQSIHIQVDPKTANEIDSLTLAVAQFMQIDATTINHVQVIKRSIDARRKPVKYNLRLAVYVAEEYAETTSSTVAYQTVNGNKETVIVGAGPAGLFAALKCIEEGVKPILIERGKDVRARRRDLVLISREQQVNEDSNYCFGEGGAGTYSDGKLYTRSKKRGDVDRILSILVAHGASPDICIDAHPHIGTNKLPEIIAAIRETIIKYGGEVLFNTRVTDVLIEENEVKGVELNGSRLKPCKVLILATGHSARDVFNLLYKKGVEIEAKPFAVGVRVEHPQQLIDQIQYHCTSRGPYLPPAAYSLVSQSTEQRGVYSFCMCPGGVIAPCATSQGEVVTNGWSPSKRNHPTANSGIVVELKLSDFSQYAQHGPLAGVAFQKEIEQKACAAAGGGQKVPAQRLVDFLEGEVSTTLPNSSYPPGMVSVDLNTIFPAFVLNALKEGFRSFEKKMKGFISSEAVVVAPETRTSSPVRIPRDKESLEHTSIKGLYPCGEGAGYAGGIMSAAIDGEKCASQGNKKYHFTN
jgi:uncharacterized FAD-dependent dehydrogenase